MAQFSSRDLMTVPSTITGKVNNIFEVNLMCTVKMRCAPILPVLIMSALEGCAVHMRRYHAFRFSPSHRVRCRASPTPTVTESVLTGVGLDGEG